ncbi:MAG: cytochrome oxidase biogenesis protein CtaA [Candidatus Dadabacteria bacterium]|nr:MAG: cytochrome oxidase biogenesis protein CtaA [Candidatus Dadabacteria bacterium]
MADAAESRFTYDALAEKVQQPGWLFTLAAGLSFCVVLLIFVGALVTSNDAGLSVPDWPTTYGRNMFLYPVSEWRGKILYEHGHRLLASGIGVITLLLAVGIFLREKRRWMKILAAIAVLAVILQGVLGGLTVLYRLPTPISVAHGMLAQTFMLLVIAIAYFLSNEYRLRSAGQVDNSAILFSPACITTALLYLQLLLGAITRHSGSGLAVPDFPKMGGMWVPDFSIRMLTSINNVRHSYGLGPVTLEQVGYHLMHRAGAVIVTVAILWLAFNYYNKIESSSLKKHLALLICLIIVQFVLGVATVLSVRDPVITSLHVATGAALLGLSFLLSLRSIPVNLYDIKNS